VDKIGSLVVAAAARHGLAGVAVAAIRPGVPPTMVCQGVADAGSGRQVDPDTVFLVASVTKTMTAIGLMQLQEAGCFGLESTMAAVNRKGPAKNPMRSAVRVRRRPAPSAAR
jgi:CubicO group peptidase (beta-lactamase class C family)